MATLGLLAVFNPGKPFLLLPLFVLFFFFVKALEG